MSKKRQLSGIINRLLFIFLLFSLIVVVGSFILKHAITVKLDNLSQQLQQPSVQPRISAILLDLDLAENSFQKASTNGVPEDLAIYNQKTDTIFKEISLVIDHYRARSGAFLPESKQQIARTLQQKLGLSRRLFDLRRNFDSLLRVTTLEKLHNRALDRKIPRADKIKIDSVVSTRKEISKSGLFRRLKEAFQTTQSVKVVTLKQSRDVTAALTQQHTKKLLAELSSQYGRLAQSGQALVLANLNLLTGLRQLIAQLEDIDKISFERSRESTLKAYGSATKDLNTFSGVALVAIVLFIFLLLVYVRRAGWAERRLLVESKRAIKLAGQKSEILAIMSHEIRNKLMAINGAVFTLKRSEITDQQKQRLNTINLASGMVLETVNNVLDVSKLEKGYAENRQSGPFIPGEAVGDAVEAMRFMAENKQIGLVLEEDENMRKTVIGDSFRLKQVMLNLLSNAIKYTDTGRVVVQAFLNEYNLLKVQITDTGSGIPKHYQSQLFTPYYQAEGHKPGTGLGLYLCREIILNQQGDISLQSEPGKGTVINFEIPYHPSTAAS